MRIGNRYQTLKNIWSGASYFRALQAVKNRSFFKSPKALGRLTALKAWRDTLYTDTFAKKPTSTPAKLPAEARAAKQADSMPKLPSSSLQAARLGTLAALQTPAPRPKVPAKQKAKDQPQAAPVLSRTLSSGSDPDVGGRVPMHLRQEHAEV